jgi:hypothetical protein
VLCCEVKKLENNKIKLKSNCAQYVFEKLCPYNITVIINTVFSSCYLLQM